MTRMLQLFELMEGKRQEVIDSKCIKNGRGGFRIRKNLRYVVERKNDY